MPLYEEDPGAPKKRGSLPRKKETEKSVPYYIFYIKSQRILFFSEKQ